MRNTIKFLRNKYLIALSAFIVLMLFIDHNDIFVQMEHQRQLKSLMTSKQFYQQQIDQTRKNLADLQNNSAALEKYAREKFFLKRDNEDVFIVVPQNNQKNNQGKQ
ncbi:MAG: septum formation initiator family protein [Parafilimonas sp.]